MVSSSYQLQARFAIGTTEPANYTLNSDGIFLPTKQNYGFEHIKRTFSVEIVIELSKFNQNMKTNDKTSLIDNCIQ